MYDALHFEKENEFIEDLKKVIFKIWQKI